MKRTGGKTGKTAGAKVGPASKSRPSAKARPAVASVLTASAPTAGVAKPVKAVAKPAPAPIEKELARNGHGNGASKPVEPAWDAHPGTNGVSRPRIAAPAPIAAVDDLDLLVDRGSSPGIQTPPIEGAPNAVQLVDDLASGKPGPTANAARTIEEWLAKRPEVLVPGIDRLIGCISSPHKRVAQTAALALPVMGRLAPARVARHLPALTDKFPQCTEIAKDGLVATFAALCTASVAYQKRLEPVLELALSTADPKTLLRWAEVILPSLKGEPHARARTVVEQRLPAMPRPQAQPIATFLGIKLRPLPV